MFCQYQWAIVAYTIKVNIEVGNIFSCQSQAIAVTWTRSMAFVRNLETYGNILSAILYSSYLQYTLVLQHFTKATNMIRFLNLVSFIMLLCHWNACLQFLVAVLLDFPPESWAVLEEVEVALTALPFPSLISIRHFLLLLLFRLFGPTIYFVLLTRFCSGVLFIFF